MDDELRDLRERLDDCQRLRDQWCSEYTALRDAFAEEKRIDWATLIFGAVMYGAACFCLGYVSAMTRFLT